MGVIAAFFDFDGTLYTGHIWQDLVRHHRAVGRQRRWAVAYIVRNMAPAPLYKLGLMSQEAFYRQWGETMGWLLRGWTVDEAQALFEQLTHEQIVPHLRSDVLALVRDHQDRGELVALVSATFAPWLETIARQVGIAHAIGTPLETRDGQYTGRIVAPLCQGPGKPIRVKSYLGQRGLEIDWAGSFGYADGGTDLDLLTQVGHPTAVYPDEVLLAHARTEGWPVIGEADQ
jgi:putative phosphoserine phosphatase/1-acylglycerol-3-phosphate O-acyltransferase